MAMSEEMRRTRPKIIADRTSAREEEKKRGRRGRNDHPSLPVPSAKNDHQNRRCEGAKPAEKGKANR